MKPSRIPKDYYGGALMTIVGLSAAYASLKYHIGSAAQMGPGYLPCVVGVLLAAVGVLIALSARRPAASVEEVIAADAANAAGTSAPPVGAAQGGHAKGLPDPRGALCIVLGVLAFLGFGTYFGLLPATFAIVFISALGDRENTLREAFALSVGMCVIALVVFHWLLQLQLPLFQWTL